jgi:hypothetical protein
MSEHPDLIRLRERDAEAVAQGYTEGDVNHYVQPVTGHLRLLERDGKPLPVEELAYYADRLHKACNAELAWILAGRRETRCNCESMNGRFGAHRPECPAYVAPEREVKQVWAVVYDSDTPSMDGTHPPVRMAEMDQERAEMSLEVIRERSARAPKKGLRIETRFVTEWEEVDDE